MWFILTRYKHKRLCGFSHVLYTLREILTESCYINQKSDFIYHFSVDSEPNGILFGLETDF